MAHYTSIEQSKRLLELGLSSKSADMCYVIDYHRSNIYGKDKYNIQIDNYGTLVQKDDNIPCWSVGALIKVIPDLNDCTLLMARNNGIFGMCFTPLDSGLSLFDTENETLIDTCVEFILRLLENGYIKK